MQVTECVEPQYRFLSKTWFECWSEGYLPTPSLRGPVKYLLCTNEQERACGVFPYVEWQKAGLTIWSLAGNYYPLRSIPISAREQREVVDAMICAVDQHRGVSAVRVGPVENEDSATHDFVAGFCRSGWAKHSADLGEQQVVTLPDSYETFHQGLGKKLRRNIRTLSNKMSRAGEMEIRSYQRLSSQGWRQVLDDVIAVESRSWIAMHPDGEPRFCDERNRSFWTRLASTPGACDDLGIWMIYLDERPVAFSVAVDSGRCRYNFAGQHDQAVDPYGTGWIVDNRLLAESIDQGIREVNMGDGHAAYKSRWGAGPGGHLRDYLLCRPSFKGRGLYGARRGKDMLDEGRTRLKKTVSGLKQRLARQS